MGDPLRLGRELAPHQLVVESAHAGRAPDNLEAPVRLRRRVDGDEDAEHVGEQIAVEVPVAVVLMPIPGAAGLGRLQRQLGVVVIDLAAQQSLGGAHHPLAAGDRAEQVVAGVGPQHRRGETAVGIPHRHGVAPVADALVARERLAHQRDFLGIEQRRHEQIAVALKPGHLVGVQAAVVHRLLRQR